MKKILLLILIQISFFCFSQQTYPLNSDAKDVPRGSYYKDLDSELNPYVGLWKGSWNSKTVYLDLRKVKYYLGTNPSNGIYQDMILGERKILEADGTVSVNRISNFDEQFPEFKGIYSKFKTPSQKQIQFLPKNMCNKTANLDITFLDTAKTQMSLHLIYNPTYMYEDCPYYNTVNQGGDFPINFPKDIVLTKQ